MRLAAFPAAGLRLCPNIARASGKCLRVRQRQAAEHGGQTTTLKNSSCARDRSYPHPSDVVPRTIVVVDLTMVLAIRKKMSAISSLRSMVRRGVRSTVRRDRLGKWDVGYRPERARYLEMDQQGSLARAFIQITAGGGAGRDEGVAEGRVPVRADHDRWRGLSRRPDRGTASDRRRGTTRVRAILTPRRMQRAPARRDPQTA